MEVDTTYSHVTMFNVRYCDELHVLLYFYIRLVGITKLRFKPAYNPYTEPSMEIFSYHEGEYTVPYCMLARAL